MAEIKRYPIDRFGDRAVGIELPFNRRAWVRPSSLHYASGSLESSAPFNSTYTTEDQAIHNLINLILTIKGERYMQPLLGSDVPNFVFEQNTPVNRFALQESLRADIAFWLPYIILGNLEVREGSSTTPGDPMHSVTIYIPFKVTEAGANRVVTFNVAQDGISFDLEN